MIAVYVKLPALSVLPLTYVLSFLDSSHSSQLQTLPIKAFTAWEPSYLDFTHNDSINATEQFDLHFFSFLGKTIFHPWLIAF